MIGGLVRVKVVTHRSQASAIHRQLCLKRAKIFGWQEQRQSLQHLETRCDSLADSRQRNARQARHTPATEQNGVSENMKAETEALVDDIRQSLTLLRRHL
jgi:hypothetical protein